MKKILVIALVLIFVITGVFLFINKLLGEKKINPQTKTFGRVDVVVTPKQVSTSKPVVFELSLNNHAINLDYNFRDIVKLTDIKGNTYKAISWTGGSGGHHVDGEISFEPLKKNARNINLSLQGIDGVTDSFSFSIN